MCRIFACVWRCGSACVSGATLSPGHADCLGHGGPRQRVSASDRLRALTTHTRRLFARRLLQSALSSRSSIERVCMQPVQLAPSRATVLGSSKRHASRSCLLMRCADHPPAGCVVRASMRIMRKMKIRPSAQRAPALPPIDAGSCVAPHLLSRRTAKLCLSRRKIPLLLGASPSLRCAVRIHRRRQERLGSSSRPLANIREFLL